MRGAGRGLNGASHGLTEYSTALDVLTINSAQGGAEAALVRDGAVLACETVADAHGLAAALPARVARLLHGREAPGLIAAVTGPGSFTGLRAGLSVAHGLALGLALPAMGVTSAEALRQGAGAPPDGRALWVALGARTGHVFLDTGGMLASFALDSLPPVSGRIAVIGNAANSVAATLAARGTDIMLLACRVPLPADIAAIALARWRGELQPSAMLPLYGEAALARPAAAGRGRPMAPA